MNNLQFYILIFSFFCKIGFIYGQTDSAKIADILNLFLEQYIPNNHYPTQPYKLQNVEIDNETASLNIFFNEAFASQAFTPDLVSTIYSAVKKKMYPPYKNYHIRVYGNNKEISSLIPNYLRKEKDKSRMWNKIIYSGNPWVMNISKPHIASKGLFNNHLSLWASHGRYYKNDKDEWQWQRPPLYCTTEDLFTQSIVVPYLIPMLEKAGAIVYTPRERDWQIHEVIVDNDESSLNKGTYKEIGNWQTSSLPGFKNAQTIYQDHDNPFHMGTSRMVYATKKENEGIQCSWIPDIPTTGKYAVYVSYQSFSNSISDAHYIIYHQGIRTDFHVNQQMGGNTWVYLGTFIFDKGCSLENSICLTNESEEKGIVSADAVRFGGGIGNIARGSTPFNVKVSGYPRFLEGARYSAQWNGMPYEVYSSKNSKNDYGDDINVRSYATNYLGSGSVYLPLSKGKNVPIELSLAIHSDAGVSKNNNDLFGSLGICTTESSDLYTHFISGLSRQSSFDFTNLLLDHVIRDLSFFTKRKWHRRELFDRNYSETRNPEIPSAIIETLSHQNYEDMKYGHDPHFKFALARAIYKAVLKFIKFQHGQSFTVQPLPVTDFHIQFTDNDNKILLNWTPQSDTLEETAIPTGYIVYTRKNNGGFDNGTYVKNRNSYEIAITPGIQYSFQVTAVNDGGESFPTEVLTVYKSPNELYKVLIVNGFNRLSGPANICTPDSVGFDLKKDIGVPYLCSTEYCGFQYNFNPLQKGTEELGYSGNELEGKNIQGNSFDYAYIHGKAMLNNPNISFTSCNKTVLEKGIYPSLTSFAIIDLIEGLEKSAPYNMRTYKTFSSQLRKVLTHYLHQGGNLFVSGAYIASDMQTTEERSFINNILKYKLGEIISSDNSSHYIMGLDMQIPIVRTLASNSVYAVMNSDCLWPTQSAFSAFLYENGSSAGTAYQGSNYRTLCLGIPFECINDEIIRGKMMNSILHFLLSKQSY